MTFPDKREHLGTLGMLKAMAEQNNYPESPGLSSSPAFPKADLCRTVERNKDLTKVFKRHLKSVNTHDCIWGKNKVKKKTKQKTTSNLCLISLPILSERHKVGKRHLYTSMVN